MTMKKILALLLTLALLLGLSGCPVSSELPQNTSTSAQTTATVATTAPVETTEPAQVLDPEGAYNSKEDVALYIHLYGCLPPNYVTKSYAQNVLGCSAKDVEDHYPNGAIGGDTFGNREGLLPKKAGRTWKECDIDTWGKSGRGAKRIVFSNDGLVYYTDDHYNSFELLYGDPNA